MVLQRTQIPEVPKNIDRPLYAFLSALRRGLLEMSASVSPPDAVTNLKATGKAGGIIIEFTRSDADSYTLLRNASKKLDGATQVDLGNSNRYVDEVGASVTTMYYWIRAKNGGSGICRHACA
jgi:hypothetical protein